MKTCLLATPETARRALIGRHPVTGGLRAVDAYARTFMESR